MKLPRKAQYNGLLELLGYLVIPHSFIDPLFCKEIREGSAPRSNPLPFCIILFFDREGTPFLYILLISGTVALYISSPENFLSLLTAVKALSFKNELNH